MKKNTVIRSDNPHTVKMQPGSNVAERKAAAKDKLHDAQARAPIDNIQHLPPATPQASTTATGSTTGKAKRQKASTNTAPDATAEYPQSRQNRTSPPSSVKAPGKAPPPTKATPGAHTKGQTLKAPAKTATPNPSRVSPKPTTPKPQASPPPPAAVWEADNPIRQRLALLRTRNAEIEEQIQRLNQSMPARGKRP